MTAAEFFPEIEPYATHRLAVDAPHEIYIEESGNPRGIPVLFVHGGPGAGCEPYHRRFFDPAAYRIVLFDQRGAGRSTPHASLELNTTAHLVSDMERLRVHLGVDRWVLFGGSWGSTLSLVYAETFPDRVLGMILRGIFLCRPWEIAWFYQQGANRIFPDYWEEFIAPIPANERGTLLRAHYRRLMSDDTHVRMASARAWSVWEGRTSTLTPNQAVIDFFASAHTALSLARIEAHYFAHDTFLEPNQILRDVERLRGIPMIAVHGRYDIVCPYANAYDLHRALPYTELQLVATAGHSASEPGIRAALLKATATMQARLA